MSVPHNWYVEHCLAVFLIIVYSDNVLCTQSLLIIMFSRSVGLYKQIMYNIIWRDFSRDSDVGTFVLRREFKDDD